MYLNFGRNHLPPGFQDPHDGFGQISRLLRQALTGCRSILTPRPAEGCRFSMKHKPPMGHRSIFRSPICKGVGPNCWLTLNTIFYWHWTLFTFKNTRDTCWFDVEGHPVAFDPVEEMMAPGLIQESLVAIEVARRMKKITNFGIYF